MPDTAALHKKKMIVVSNRLPFRVTDEGNDLQFIPSVGGLATGLSSYLQLLRRHPTESQDYLWVGWPGSTISEAKQDEVRARSFSEFSALPVFLSDREIERFYQGFCNKTIWPLFHYFQVYTNYDEVDWAHYVEVNRNFCRTLLGILGPEDTLWIHDFHLMLLPGMVRDQAPSATIGFFLHIPFPHFEIYRLLPRKWRRRILEGLLGADLLGFHTNDYKQEFLRCVLRILGHDSSMGEIIVGDRVVKAEAFPMGIDYEKYHDGSSDPAIQREKSRLRGRLGEAKVVISIDRLDYTKGIVHRLEGFQTFLENYPAWRGKVVLILLVVPSRTDVEHYEMMKGQIETLVGRINGQFGGPHWTPIIYMFRTLTFEPLCALYAASHVALVTPLRDGMNLIAKEYVASRSNQTGVLILSEMAGASKELVEAILINPNNRVEIAEALLEALEMPEEEQMRRIALMQQRLQRHTVLRWATDFMDELRNTIGTGRKYHAKVLGPEGLNRLVQHYCRSSRRLFMLDYDGTLVPFAMVPDGAVPSPSLLDVLHKLSEELRNEIVIISGRQKVFLDAWFSNLPINLVAEHGTWIKEKNSDWRQTVTSPADWKLKLKPLFELYADRVVGSIVEEKDFALVWHYRWAELEPAKLAAQELKDHLLALTANIDVHVLQGNKTVEVRVAGVNKGTAGHRFFSRDPYDFILCIGNDMTDEDLFAILPENAYSIRVGLGGTYAKHTIINVQEVARLLHEIAAHSGD